MTSSLALSSRSNLIQNVSESRVNAPSPSSPGLTRLQDQVRDEMRWTEQANDQGVRLRQNAVSILRPAQGEDPKGTVVMFHGFTAGPWQYKEMAEQLNDEGYHVYAPRMPGHGLVDESGKPWRKDIPEAGEGAEWNEFIDKTIDDAEGLGAPVYTVGLSGGGGVALQSAQRHEEIQGVAAMAPFVGGDGVVGMLLPVLSVVDTITFGLFGKLLNAIPMGKAKLSSIDDPTPRTPASLGQAVAMYRVGATAKEVEQPLQLLTTAKDTVSGVRANRTRYEGGAGGEANGWYHFPEQEKVKHAMLSRLENPNVASVETLEQVVTDFITEGIVTDRLPG